MPRHLPSIQTNTKHQFQSGKAGQFLVLPKVKFPDLSVNVLHTVLPFLLVCLVFFRQDFPI
jgi:hypothetical protein